VDGELVHPYWSQMQEYFKKKKTQLTNIESEGKIRKKMSVWLQLGYGTNRLVSFQ
jgi:hypothetical protein